MFRRGRLACSFCGKDATEVAKLVAGPKVYICDRCVALASEIMAGRGGDTSAAAAPPPPGRLVRLMGWLGTKLLRRQRRLAAALVE